MALSIYVFIILSTFVISTLSYEHGAFCGFFFFFTTGKVWEGGIKRLLTYDWRLGTERYTKMFYGTTETNIHERRSRFSDFYILERNLSLH